MQLKIHCAVDGHVSGTVCHNDADGRGGLAPALPLNGKALDEFLGELHAGRHFEMGLLPPAVRWISKDKTIVVFERLPMKQVISFIPMKKEFIRNGEDYSQYMCSYEINLPWTVYVVSFDRTYLPGKIKVLTRNHPLQSLDDTVGLLPLLNFYNNSMLCNPTFGTFEGMPANLGEGINMAYNMVWNSGFNYDLVDAINQASSVGVPFRKIPKYKDYTEAEQNAQGKGVINWHRYWQSLSMEEVLSIHWPAPGLGQRDGIGMNPVRLRDVITRTQKEIATEFPKASRTFLVNLVGSLV